MNSFCDAAIVLWAPDQAELWEAAKILRKLGSTVRFVRSRPELEDWLRRSPPNAILAVVRPSFREPIEFLCSRGRDGEPTPFVVAVASADVPLYLDAIEYGAFDAVALPIGESDLVRIVDRALKSVFHPLVARVS